ncbi:hypothetical protein N7490_006170 [Penicillium lividum]|nr:hypothetical protein N7490_006170 [Penicillium lividum]
MSFAMVQELRAAQGSAIGQTDMNRQGATYVALSSENRTKVPLSKVDGYGSALWFDFLRCAGHRKPI